MPFVSSRLNIPNPAKWGASVSTWWHGVVSAVLNRQGSAAAQAAVSLGSASTPIVRRKRGLTILEPSYVSVDMDANEITSIGEVARRMDGRAPSHLKVVRPIREGAVVHGDLAVAMLQQMFKRAGLRTMFGPSVMVAMPPDLSALERRAIEDVVHAAGAHKTWPVDEAVALAIGAGRDVMQPHGTLVIDVGGGGTRASIVSMGETLIRRAARVGGDAMDDAIRDYVRQKHGVLIGQRTAERVKHAVGCAVALEPPTSIEVGGRDLISGLPAYVRVTSEDARAALQPALDVICAQVKLVLEDAPPPLLADVAREGAVLAGGAARLRGLDRLLQDQTGLPITAPAAPEKMLAEGLHRLLDDKPLRQRLLMPARPRKSLHVHAAMPRAVAASASLLLCIGFLLWLAVAGKVAAASALNDTLDAALAPLWTASSKVMRWTTSAQNLGDSMQQSLMADLREKNRHIAQLQAENARLAQTVMLKKKRLLEMSLTGARVVARDPRGWHGTLVLDVGKKDGVTKGLIVTSAHGVVGQIADVSQSTCRVRMLTHPKTVFAARVVKRPAAGVVYGTSSGTCELRYLDPEAGVKDGDFVLTTGQDGTFPAGLAVGRVTRVQRARDAVATSVVLKPAVPFDDLREVFVLKARG